MTQEEILETQRKERLYRHRPELRDPAFLPDTVLKNFALSGNSEVKISFILPFRGIPRLNLLNKCVENLVLRYPYCEILVIEENSTPIIKQPLSGAKYMFVYSRQLFNKSKCFNIGFLVATHDIICGLDADMLIPSILIDKTIDKIKENKVVFPGREIYYIHDQVNVNNLAEKIWNHKTWTKDRATTQFHGGIFICNKKAFAKVGGFDQRFIGYGSEDTSFYMRSTDLNNGADTMMSADTTRVIDLLHIDHNHDDVEQQAVEINQSLLHALSHLEVNKRIADCKNNNIFNKK